MDGEQADASKAGTADTGAQSGATAPPRRRRRRLWALLGALGLVVRAVVAVVVVVQDDPPRDYPDVEVEAEEATRLTRDDWDGTLSGVYRRTDPEAVEEFEDFREAPVDLVAEFSARDDWTQVSEPRYLFRAWDDTDRRLVLALPMLPADVDDVSMEQGAEGEYDDYFELLGEGLVDAGLEDTILRIGWEFNIDGWAWSNSDAETYVAYWRRIVAALDSVEGQQFRYDWNPNNAGPSSPDPVDWYPGDDVVDYIGLDAYDVAGSVYPVPDDCSDSCLEELSQEAWDEVIYGGDRGLRFWSDFAAQHDKQLSLPEWGVWDRTDGIGGGDNPYYIERMAEFIADPDNRVGYEMYFEDANRQGTHRLMTDLPESGERYVELFGGGDQ